jgi:hypothetical protein
MAIPEGRLSTEVVEGNYLEPDGKPYKKLESWERGPLGITDTSLGLLYQNWVMTYDAGSGNMTVTPQTAGVPSVALTVPGVLQLNFTFDQNGRIAIAYSTAVSSYLYWYDSGLPGFTTTDLGATSLHPNIMLDDKREAEDSANDMLLWYCEDEGGGTFELFMLRQRDRFLTPISMATGLEQGYIRRIGMTDNLRVKIQLGAET